MTATTSQAKVFLGGLRTLEIATHAPDPTAAATVALLGSLDGKSIEWSTAQLGALPIRLPPLQRRGPGQGRNRKRARGWSLADIVSVIAPVENIATVTCVGATSTLSFEQGELASFGADIEPGATWASVKRNKQGLLQLTVFRASEQQLETIKQVRDLQKIDIVTTK